jgi:uncharacterized protein YcbK (DUF882 family)
MKWDNIKFFKEHEFFCKHCGKIIPMDFPLINGLDYLREIFGVPITITSGYRCPVHNKNVGGAKNSFHTTGKAADISVARKNLLPLIYKVAIVSKRFNGIGLSEHGNFIHLDTGNRATPYYYVYLPAGGYKQLNPDILKKIKSETIEEHLREYKV